MDNEEVDGDDHERAEEGHEEGRGAEDDRPEAHHLVVVDVVTLVPHRVRHHRREEERHAARQALRVAEWQTTCQIMWVTDNISDYVGDRVTDNMSDALGDRVTDNISNDVGDRVTDNICQTLKRHSDRQHQAQKAT